ncbi:ankyrin repeat-containing protein ITN1-like [Prunus avium]|uniref:Ankyrin repeat-containing protein ITN1-like n=1 Tax=Prunus avium TaxID=42229 RepID=A0A6P5RVZ5_PRUAV|nr:ankyrin repeat-containing protein ITN1-like [Prunus avium]
MEEIDEVEIIGEELSRAREQYEWAMNGRWESLKRFYKDHVFEVFGQMTTKYDTVLQVAGLAGRKDVLQFLISQIEDRDALIVANNRGNTPLHEVAASGNLDAAQLLVEYSFDHNVESSYASPVLVEIKNHLGETPLYRAAAFGRTDLVQYLANQVDDDKIEQHFQRKDQVSILHIAVLGQHFGLCKDDNIDQDPANQNDDLESRFNQPSQSTFSNKIMTTRTGISQIVEKILKCHPQAVEAHDIKHQQNILHMAIKYRRLAIFKIVKKNKFITSRLADTIDSDGNSILHHAADMSYYTDTSYYSVDAKGTYGPAFQLQEELQWMARVQKIIPVNYTMHRNKKGVTADELFSRQHAKLLQSAKVWMKETAQSGSVVAALVATVAYAAEYTVPGGTNQNGLPNLWHSPFFKAFTISNTVSLIFSLTSLGTFLNITRSPFEYKNFQHSLPFKLNLGFLLLFCSLLVSMLSFAATIVRLIHHQKIWSISLIYVVVAILPFSVFGLNRNPFYEVFFKGWKYIKKKLRCCKVSC